LKDYEKKLQRVKDEVSRAIQTLSEQHTGTDLAEARGFLEKAAEAIKKNKFDKALSFAAKARLSANPGTKYLLDKAKDLEASGNKAYKKEEFAQAVELWHKSLEEYGKVRELALERGEDEIVKALESMTKSLAEDTRVAEREKANKDMVASGEQANKIADEAEGEFNAGNFTAAREKFESARNLYARGAALAAEFDFEDEAMLNEAAGGMETSIEACLLSQGRVLLEVASREEGSRKENAFTEVVKYLESFSSDSNTYEELRKRAYEGVAAARIEIGAKLMEDAEALLAASEHYVAKEKYRNAQRHFEELSDFAVEHKLERQKEEIDKLLDDCVVNVKVCTDSLLGREKITAGKVRKVGNLRKGVGIPAKAEFPYEKQIRELEKEYDLMQYLGSGGFGHVYQAKTRDGAVIAIKVLSEVDTRSEDIFFRELKVWQDLVHANIVKMIRPRFHPAPLFEMEYVDGGDLGGLLEGDKALPRDRACQIASDIARGLQYAHSYNIVHGDLKPENILFMKTGEAKITDWGLGKFATSTSRGRGYTPGYAAPEQVEKYIIDKRSDIYQLGLLLYEMLTGDNPFAHGTLEERDKKVLTFIPRRPSEVNQELELLDGIIMRCLEKDPSSRPGIEEFREVLRSYMVNYLGIPLPDLSADRRAEIEGLSQRILLEAKGNNYQECTTALSDLVAKLGNQEKKEAVLGLIAEVESRQKEGGGIEDGVSREINALLRWMEYGEPQKKAPEQSQEKKGQTK
jgi:hypothetical protein